MFYCKGCQVRKWKVSWQSARWPFGIQFNNRNTGNADALSRMPLPESDKVSVVEMDMHGAWSNEKYWRILLYNTKPAPSLRRTFSRRNRQKKKRSGNKMAVPEAAVHPVRNRLCYHFILYHTNETCSRIVSTRLMLLRSSNKSYLWVTAPNATEAERPFYECSRILCT